MGIPDWQKPFIKESSIPLPDGGDTHIHPFGSNENDFVITTRIPVGDGLTHDIHDKPDFEYLRNHLYPSKRNKFQS